MDVCGTPNGFLKEVNEHLRKLWESRTGFDPYAKKEK
jgi:hypothetical protein